MSEAASKVTVNKPTGPKETAWMQTRQLLDRAIDEAISPEETSSEIIDVVDAILVLAELDGQRWVLEPLRTVFARHALPRCMIWRWAIAVEVLDDECSQIARRVSSQLDWRSLAEYVVREPLAHSSQMLSVLRRVNEYVRQLDIRLHVMLLERCAEVGPEVAVQELVMIGAALHPLQQGSVLTAELAGQAERLREAGVAAHSLWLLDAACELCVEMSRRGALVRLDVIAECYRARGELYLDRGDLTESAEDLHAAAAILELLADADPAIFREVHEGTRALLEQVQLAACRSGFEDPIGADPEA